MQTRLLRPEGTSLLRVLQVVSDDVGLLEEETHGVGQLGVLPHLWVLQLGRGEQLRQPDPYQPCHVVTILSGIKQNRNVGKHNETHGETNVVEEQRDAVILDCYIFIYFHPLWRHQAAIYQVPLLHGSHFLFQEFRHSYSHTVAYFRDDVSVILSEVSEFQ